jgi:hypothetical protein
LGSHKGACAWGETRHCLARSDVRVVPVVLCKADRLFAAAAAAQGHVPVGKGRRRGVRNMACWQCPYGVFHTALPLPLPTGAVYDSADWGVCGLSVCDGAGGGGEGGLYLGRADWVPGEVGSEDCWVWLWLPCDGHRQQSSAGGNWTRPCACRQG